MARAVIGGLGRGGVIAFSVALVLNPVFKVVVRRRGMTGGVALAERLGGRAPLATGSRYDVHRARRLAHGVHLAARIPPVDVVCLPRALTLWSLLRRRGVPAELVIGVEDPSSAFAAHAWVRVQGVDIGEDPAQLARFHPMERPVLGEVRDAG